MKGDKIQVVIDYIIAIINFILAVAAGVGVFEYGNVLIYSMSGVMWLVFAISQSADYKIAKAKEEMQNEVNKLKEEIDRLEKEIKSAHILKGEYWEEYKK